MSFLMQLAGCLYWDGAGVQLPPASPVSRTTNSGIGERIAAFDEIGEERGVRAKSLRANRGHGGTHAKPSGFVGRGADHGAIAAPGNNDRLAAQLRIIALLYRRIKGVHVDMNDFPHGQGAAILFSGGGPGRASPEV
jgi:hypothetical protein